MGIGKPHLRPKQRHCATTGSHLIRPIEADLLAIAIDELLQFGRIVGGHEQATDGLTKQGLQFAAMSEGLGQMPIKIACKGKEPIFAVKRQRSTEAALDGALDLFVSDGSGHGERQGIFARQRWQEVGKERILSEQQPTATAGFEIARRVFLQPEGGR